jgi:hypothetical protein
MQYVLLSTLTPTSKPQPLNPKIRNQTLVQNMLLFLGLCLVCALGNILFEDNVQVLKPKP